MHKYSFRFSVDFAALDHLDNPFCDSFEHFLNFMPILSRSLEIAKAMSRGKLLSLFRTHLATKVKTYILILQIAFVSDDHRLDLVVRIVLDLE